MESWEDTMEYETPQVRVDRGAAKLDEAVPDWAPKVKDSILAGVFQMGSWNACIAGTLELVTFIPDEEQPSGKEVVVTFNGTRIVGDAEMTRHGFDVDLRQDEAYEDLEKLWLAKIEERIHASA
jgi:hypothetical protein